MHISIMDGARRCCVSIRRTIPADEINGSRAKRRGLELIRLATTINTQVGRRRRRVRPISESTFPTKT